MVRVLVVYAGASWLILEGTGVFVEQLGLPSWMFPAAIVFLGIGLVIIVTTAWVQGQAAAGGAPAADQPAPWEVDLVDLKEAVAGGRLPYPTWGRAILGGVVAFSLLLGAAGVYVLVTGRSPALPTPGDAETAATPGVAVLPFRVVGSDLDLWREGMVDLLSTNLDGAAGLRAIDPRGLLSRWRARVGDADDPGDRAAALEVASSLGASYAVIGSAVNLGGGVRLTAEVFELPAGNSLGTAQVEGSPDSVLGLVDRLSIQVLGAGLAQEGAALPSIDVSQVTTTSVAALRAYLEGEQKYRRGDWEGAAADFFRAIEQDSTFALVWYRLANAVGWIEGFASTRAAEYSQRAFDLSDRLPERAALKLRGSAELDEARRQAVYTLEELTSKYPDDVEGWYSLGEAYVHLGQHAFRPREKEAEALRRALELDPGFLAAFIHTIENVIQDGDSAEARRLIDAYRDLSPNERAGIGFDLVHRFVFGDSDAQAAADLDTLDGEAFREGAEWSMRHAPDQWERGLELFGLLTRPHRPADDRARGYNGLGWIYALRGRLVDGEEAFAEQHRIAPALSTAPSGEEYLPYLAFRWGYGDADAAQSAVDAAREHATATPPEDRTFPGQDLFFLGALAADLGRWGDVESSLAELQRMADEAASSTGTRVRLQALASESLARALRSYGSLRRGDLATAVAEYEQPMPRLAPHARALMLYELGVALLDDGQLQQAERYLFNLSGTLFAAPAEYQLGRLFEARDDPEKARLHYGRFVRRWEDCDPELRLWWQQGRDALERLTREG